MARLERSSGKRLKRTDHKLELQMSWMLGCLLLLIANATYFRKMGVSLGDPWLNWVLLAIVLLFLVRLSAAFIHLHREQKRHAAGIAEIDRMDDEAFLKHMADYFAADGWVVSASGLGTLGGWLELARDDRRLCVVTRLNRRKLTHEYIGEVVAQWSKSGHGGVLVITNGQFTTEARRAARKTGLTLWDRGTLIHQLASRRRRSAVWGYKQKG